MLKITFLGTASAVPNIDQQNSHLLIETDQRLMLVDCVGNPVVRLAEASVNPLRVSDLVLTHFHPDHVSGVPLFLMDLWLMGREAPLAIYGLDDVMDRFSAMMDLYDWQDWTGLYPVHHHCIPAKSMMPLISMERLKVWGSLVCHMIPAMGLRVESNAGTIAYSTDTGPCDAVVELAKGADMLIHEASGEAEGHTSAAQAGEVAAKAGVKQLILTHYAPQEPPEALIAEAMSTFGGEVHLATDLATFSLG